MNKGKRQVREGLEDWVGNYGAATIRQLGDKFKNNPEGNISAPQRMARDMFIKDFISSAYAALSSEIRSGRVDPNLRTNDPPQSATVASAQSAAQPQRAPQPTSQSLDMTDYKRRRDAERTMAIQHQRDAQAQVQRTAAANAATSAQDNELVAKVRAEKQKPGFQQDKGMIRRAAAKGIHETKYQKLNRIFENLLTESESIGQFFMRWLPTHMKGVNLNDPVTAALIKNIESSYATDKGKAALTKLAHSAYASSMAPGYGSTQSTTKSQRTVPTNPLVSDITNALTKLKTTDPAAYDSLVQSLTVKPGA